MKMQMKETGGMQQYQVINALRQATQKHGLMCVLETVFGAGVKIRIPFSGDTCEQDIMDLGLSVRSYHGLMRSDIKTIGGVVDAVQSDALMGIRGLGKNSCAEIRVALFELGYNCLSDVQQRDFWRGLLEDTLQEE